MAAQAATARKISARRRGGAPAPERGRLSWVASIPPWARIAIVAAVLLALIGAGAYSFYQSLDRLYPQELWKYFRSETPVASGSVLYRDQDGQLFIAPVGKPDQGRRLLDAPAAARGREFVRDAVVLPGGKQVAYYATVRPDGQTEQDRIKVVTLDGAQVRDIAVTEVTREPMRPTVFVSASGQYLGVTNRDRSHAYYYDLAGQGGLVPGQMDAPPERMLWNKNADLRQAHQAGAQAFALSPDNKLRAQVRAGRRRVPECDEQRCEPSQELVVAAGTVAGSAQPPVVLFGAFSSFDAEGWGPIPAQQAQRLYGRLVWSPDGRQLLFSTLGGSLEEPTYATYAISADGSARPRLVLPAGEALDWLP